MVGYEGPAERKARKKPAEYQTKVDDDLDISVGDPVRVSPGASPARSSYRVSQVSNNMTPPEYSVEESLSDIDIEKASKEEPEAFNPIERPQCMTFLETGKCKFGNACYWNHGANPGRTKSLNCPKKHGLRKVKLEQKTQCTSCQNLLFDGDVAYVCKSCRFSTCLICAAAFAEIVRPEQVD